MAKSLQVGLWGSGDDATTLKRLKDILTALPCVSAVNDIDADAKPSAALPALDVLVVLIDEESGDASAVWVQAAGRSGIRAVGVYGPDTADISSDLERYGAATVLLDAAKLRRVICEGEVIWDKPTGEPRAKRKTPRKPC
jgi:hypothetical protein